MKVPKRGAPMAFAGIRANGGRGKGHRRPWTAASSLAFLCIIFIVLSCGQAKPATQHRLLRLGTDQWQEILRYIHAQEKEEEGGKKEGVEEEANKSRHNTKEGGGKWHDAIDEGGKKEAKWHDDAVDEGNKKEEDDAIDVPLSQDNAGGGTAAGKWRDAIENSIADVPSSLSSDECQQQLDPEEQSSLQTKIRHFLHSQLQHVWSDQFTVQVLGMNVNIHSIRARHIRPPHVQIHQLGCPSNGGAASSLPDSRAIVASLSGGSLSIRANYRSVYRTVRVGTVRIRLGQFRGKLGGDGEECANAAAARILSVHLRPRLLDEVDEAVADHLRERVRHLVCNRLQLFLRENYGRRRR